MTSPARSVRPKRGGGGQPALTAVAQRLLNDHGITVQPTTDLPAGVIGELDLPARTLATHADADPRDQVWLLADALALLTVGEPASLAQPVVAGPRRPVLSLLDGGLTVHPSPL